jgi:transcriptional regulator with XRE-family HTH domain
MPSNGKYHNGQLTGHALRNAGLRQRSLARSQSAPPLARLIVRIRAETLGMTRLEFTRRSGISRGTLRDVELGIHTPTRRVLRKFLAFCQQRQVPAGQLEELRRLYAGPGETVGQLIARLELRAGSARELARRVGISPTTLWEYRRGNFPLGIGLLRRLCRAVDEDPAPAEALWHDTERRRLVERGYPEALAEFWARCAGQGYGERQLAGLGMGMAAVRRLRYLELPSWPEIAPVARQLGLSEGELQSLQEVWQRDERRQHEEFRHGFGLSLKEHRLKQGISRRELADLFGIGGKKPARIIKYIEEDGFYSARAFPAGLTAILVKDAGRQAHLLQLWAERRRQFHCRHRPETQVDMRLTRELFGFELRDMEPILGYTNLEYQQIERGITSLLDTARNRIVEAIHQAGRRRVQVLLQKRRAQQSERLAWLAPSSVRALVVLLAKREGGLVPLGRLLKRSGLKGLWTARLRALAQGKEIPAWRLLEKIGSAGGVADLTPAHRDWQTRFRAKLQATNRSPLGVEVRLLIAEVATTPRAFSDRLPMNYSVLVRDLQRIDRDEPIKWVHVERILRAAGLPMNDRWREIHALWYTAAERRKRLNPPRGPMLPRLA